MKRNITVVIFILLAFSSVHGQNNEPVDLVLLLNTSSEMSSSYESVNDYITGPFLSEFLRIGDTFHLIVFSQSPKLDIARKIGQRGDVETIIGRMLLQYPVENGNNIAAAITYAESYISSLPSRPKKIVLVTTGGQDINSIVNAAKDRLRAKNTTFDFVQVTSGQPLTNLPQSGRGSAASSGTGSTVVSSSVTGSTGGSAQGTSSSSGTTSQVPASTQGTASTGTSSSGTGSTGGSVQVTSSVSGTTSQGTASTQGAASTGTSSLETVSTGETAVQGSSGSQGSDTAESDNNAGTKGISATSEKSSDNKKVSENETTSSKEKTTGVKTSSNASGDSSSSSSMGLIVLIIILILVLGPVIFLMSRRISSGPRRSAAKPVSPEEKPKEKPLSSTALSASTIQKQKDKPPQAAAQLASSRPKEKPSQTVAKPALPVQKTKEKSPQFADHSKELASYAAVQSKQRTTPYSDRPIKTESQKLSGIDPSAPLLLNMFVEDQSLSIGKRNIHSLKSGYSFSVGGGKADDFLIFLVPVPQHIGEIHRSGSQLTFIPRKHKYFPDLGSNELRDCLNKTIRVISDRNYEIRFRFETYEDPLLALNRVLQSIKVPG
jgi:hypothetical protein